MRLGSLPSDEPQPNWFGLQADSPDSDLLENDICFIRTPRVPNQQNTSSLGYDEPISSQPVISLKDFSLRMI